MKLVDISTKNRPNIFAMVDDEDFEKINGLSWSPLIARKSKTIYAWGVRFTDGIKENLYMHKELLNPPSGYLVDHIDGNGLNNQKSNLRIVTPSQNQHNRFRVCSNTSGIVGVRKLGKVWIARITINNKRIHLGSFKDIRDAVKARLSATKEYHGEHANNSIIQEMERLIYGNQ